MRTAAVPVLLAALLLAGGPPSVRSQAFATTGGAVQVCKQLPPLRGASVVT